MITKFFRQNVDIIFVIYSLSFIVMSVVILIQRRRENIFKLSYNRTLEEVNTVKNYLGNIIRSMVDALIVVDVNARIKTVNPAVLRLLGYKKEELLDQPVTMILVEKEPLFTTASLKNVIETGFIKNYEVAFKTKNGSLIPMLFSGSLLIDKNGSVEGVVGIAKDITERKKSEQELQSAYSQLQVTQNRLFQVEKMDTLGELATGVAHEVKNPLAIIMQGVGYLRGKMPLKEAKVSETLSYIEEAVKRADEVIGQLLDFSSVSKLSIEAVKLNILADNALLLLSHQLAENKIEVVKNYGEDVPEVKVDKNRIEQVLVNLMLNSIQAMDSGGKLTISTYIYAQGAATTLVNLEIEDTGEGIPNENFEKIFDPFFTTKRGQGSKGLGLAVVKNIIEMHEGMIRVENKKDAQGVRAILTFKVEQ